MFEIDKQQFGMFLSRLRKEKRLTQRQLADSLYLSDKAVSKWETGQSLPDITLLKPLADFLGVTVTELLEGRRLEAAPMEPEQVEGLLRKAAQFSVSAPKRAKPTGKRLAVYFSCVFLAVLELLAVWTLRIPVTESLVLAIAFPIGFGAYFWLVVQTYLPEYYDGNSISFWSDGPLRMNIPGVRFTNRNWPYIVKTLRIWSAVTMTVYPLIHLGGALLLSELWHQAELYVFLTAVLGGMFIPLILVGKRYE